MTNEPNPSTGNYKQVYVRANKLKPYSQAKIGLDDYVQTNVWRELRNERLKIDHYRCQYCGTGINVQVHHKRYPEIWGTESVDDDLITLCDRCHAETHINDFE